MSRKIIILTIILVGILWFGLSGRTNRNLVNPQIQVPSETPNAPKTFKYDSSTDLKMELEKVNPQVLDADFE